MDFNEKLQILVFSLLFIIINLLLVFNDKIKKFNVVILLILILIIILKNTML